MTKSKRIEEFNFKQGEVLSYKYEVIRKLGGGWEGEVYLIKEIATGIERAAKIFYPQRNKNNKTLKIYAKKLHHLRNCNSIIQYMSQETLWYKDFEIVYLVSEFVEGLTLTDFVNRRRGKRLQPFVALHLLHALSKSIEEIHYLKEYHGDLHTDNIIVQQFGLEFKLKLIDFFHWGKFNRQCVLDDTTDMIRVLYDVTGGKKFYKSQPAEIKDICCGLKKSILHKKFKSAAHLRVYLENMHWENF